MFYKWFWAGGTQYVIFKAAKDLLKSGTGTIVRV